MSKGVKHDIKDQPPIIINPPASDEPDGSYQALVRAIAGLIVYHARHKPQSENEQKVA